MLRFGQATVLLAWKTQLYTNSVSTGHHKIGDFFVSIDPKLAYFEKIRWETEVVCIELALNRKQ